jgi:hypothetical protein
MTTYNTLKKIIPPDQALANQALSRSLRQVKDIFRADLPGVSEAVSNLESNKDLDLINALTTPIPAVVTDFVGNILATGTGPGNTITTNDVIGIAAGATVTVELPVVTEVVTQLADAGALAPLTANGGSSSSSVNGIYTLMSYTLAGAYTSVIDPGPPVVISVTIPNTTWYAGPQTFSSVDDAFATAGTGLIAVANGWISNIAANNSALASQANEATDACAQQLVLNVNNCTAAGIDIGNVVNDIANANLVPNSISTVLGLTSQLHDIGLDVTEGGAAQFFENIANTSNITGQAVISSMREGRNIALLNAVGIVLDTQLIDVNPNQTVANNLQDAQYSVAQAQGNIII